MIGATPDSSERADRVMGIWTDESASESLYSSWKSSRLIGALETMLSTTNSSRSLGKRPRLGNQDSSTGAERIWDFRVRSSSVPSGPRVSTMPHSSTSPKIKRARLSPRLSGQSPPQPPSGNNGLQLPPQASQLLDVYFTVTHSWLPIVAKHSILRASYQYANSPFYIANTSPESGDHAVLWAILSYTSAQSAPQDDLPGVHSETMEYYSAARKLIPPEEKGYELGHVQALLLLTLVNIGLEDWTAAWFMSGHAVRMVTGMGFGVRPDDKVGKAVYLGCFIVDTFLSFHMSRAPCMRSEDLANVGLLEEDGLEEWNNWVDMLSLVKPTSQRHPPRQGPVLALSCFNRLVELACVLNKVTCASLAGSDSFAFCEQLLLELGQWESHLSPGCRLTGLYLDNLEKQLSLLPHQSYLCLTYIATRLWLYMRRVSQEPASSGYGLGDSSKLLCKVLQVIYQHLENFKSCSLPPMFGIPLRSIVQQALSVRDRVGFEMFPFVQWVETFSLRITDLRRTWAIYHSLAKDIDSWNLSQHTRNPLAFPLRANSMNQPQVSGVTSKPSRAPNQDMMATGLAQLQSNAPSFYSTRTAEGPLSVTGSSENAPSTAGIDISVNQYYMTPTGTGMPLQPDIGNQNFPDTLRYRREDESDSLLRPTGHVQPSTPESSLSAAAFNTSNPALSRNSTSPNVSGRGNESGELFELQSTSDIDSIFRDLAYLDTTEWATNREAGLRDFGFMDDTAFQAFCHDPDRLAGFEPLSHPPNIAGMWQPPGFHPETFHGPTNERSSE